MSKYATQIDGRSQDGVLSVTCLHTKVVTENTHAPVLSNLMWLCSSFTIAHTEDESSSNLHMLKGKWQCILIFYVNMSTKKKTKLKAHFLV